MAGARSQRRRSTSSGDSLEHAPTSYSRWRVGGCECICDWRILKWSERIPLNHRRKSHVLLLRMDAAFRCRDRRTPGASVARPDRPVRVRRSRARRARGTRVGVRCAPTRRRTCHRSPLADSKRRTSAEDNPVAGYARERLCHGRRAPVRTSPMSVEALVTEAERYLEAVELFRSLELDVSRRADVNDVRVADTSKRSDTACTRCPTPHTQINGRTTCLSSRPLTALADAPDRRVGRTELQTVER